MDYKRILGEKFRIELKEKTITKQGIVICRVALTIKDTTAEGYAQVNYNKELTISDNFNFCIDMAVVYIAKKYFNIDIEKGEESNNVVEFPKSQEIDEYIEGSCILCGYIPTSTVKDFALRKFGKIYCRRCQDFKKLGMNDSEIKEKRMEENDENQQVENI